MKRKTKREKGYKSKKFHKEMLKWGWVFCGVNDITGVVEYKMYLLKLNKSQKFSIEFLENAGADVKALARGITYETIADLVKKFAEEIYEP